MSRVPNKYLAFWLGYDIIKNMGKPAPKVRVFDGSNALVDPEACGQLLSEYGLPDSQIPNLGITVTREVDWETHSLDFLPGQPAASHTLYVPTRVSGRERLKVSLGSLDAAVELSEESTTVADEANKALAAGLHQLSYVAQTPLLKRDQEKRAAVLRAVRHKLWQGALAGGTVASVTGIATYATAEMVGPPLPTITAALGVLGLVGVGVNTLFSYREGQINTIKYNNAFHTWPYQVAARQAGNNYLERMRANEAPALITFPEGSGN